MATFAPDQGRVGGAKSVGGDHKAMGGREDFPGPPKLLFTCAAYFVVAVVSAMVPLHGRATISHRYIT
jgi:hypothetical protein